MADSARAEVTQKTHICLILLPPCTMFCYKVTPEYGAEVVFLLHKRGHRNLIFSIVCCHPVACFVIIRRLCVVKRDRQNISNICNHPVHLLLQGNPVWSFLWFLGLLFAGWPIAGFCAGWYILILPFQACFDGLTVSCKTFKIII